MKFNPLLYGVFVFALFVGIGYFAPLAHAHSGVRVEHTISATSTLLTGPGFGSFAIDVLTDPPNQEPFERCGAGGGGFGVGSNISNHIIGSLGYNEDCEQWIFASTSIVVLVGDSSSYDIFEGTLGGNDWHRYVDPGSIYATRVIRINEPVLYATSTSPIDIQFDALVTTDGYETDGYKILLRHDNTGQVVTYYGLLPDYDLDVPFSVSTTSIAVPLAGAWTLQMSLGGGTAEKLENPSLPWYTNGYVTATHFGIGVYDSGENFTTIPYNGPEYTSSACSINFLGTFSLGECVGYLVQPASSTVQSFNQLTLREKFPFAYMYGIGDMRTALFNSPTTASSSVAVAVPGFGTITFISTAMIAAVPFAPTIKIILTALMWLLTLELLYVTILRSHNNNTGV